jgi:hypothetical protein
MVMGVQDLPPQSESTMHNWNRPRGQAGPLEQAAEFVVMLAQHTVPGVQ